MSHSKVQVILLYDFAKKGKFGDKILVNRGYAKNYLLPNNMALYANAANTKKFDEIKQEAQARAFKEKNAALALLKQIEDIDIVIPAVAGQDGKIFGAIVAKDILSVIEAILPGVILERNKILLLKPIKHTGDHKIKFALHPDVEFEKSIKVFNTTNSRIEDNDDEDATTTGYDFSNTLNTGKYEPEDETETEAE